MKNNFSFRGGLGDRCSDPNVIVARRFIRHMVNPAWITFSN
jgi:hypothetical protein